MFPGSTMLNYLFWMALGALQVLIVAGAYAWLDHYGKKIKWWQMLLLYGGFCSFCLIIAAGATLSGEYETVPGLYFIGFFSVPTIIAMAIMIKLFIFPKAPLQEPAEENK